MGTEESIQEACLCNIKFRAIKSVHIRVGNDPIDTVPLIIPNQGTYQARNHG